jgi:hypothetical protein
MLVDALGGAGGTDTVKVNKEYKQKASLFRLEAWIADSCDIDHPRSGLWQPDEPSDSPPIEKP